MVIIVKSTGEKEPFSEEKLYQSIRRAGVPKELTGQVIHHVKKSLYENVPTSEIYQHISEFLEKSSPYAAARYSLKKALMDLGPTGYPFEDYISKILTKQGYSVTVRNSILGTCINHEVDVVAEKSAEKIMVEAKFHNSLGIKTDVQVALYTKARFDDVKEKGKFTKALLVTNTKITSDVAIYATCVGMKVLSWDYPEEESLRELVEKYNMFPITALSKLPMSFKQKLLEQGIVLCNDVCLNPSVIEQFELSKEEKQFILEEAKFFV